MQFRSKRSELPTNVDAIKVSDNSLNGGTRGGLALFDIDPSIHFETMETDSNTVSNFAVINVPRTSLTARIKSMRVVHNTFENINSAEWNLESELVQIENNTFTCSNSGMPLSSMAMRKYELQVRASSRQQIASSSFRPDFSILLGGNSFVDGDLLVTILNDDTTTSTFSADITNNQTNGNVTINTYDTETDISGNTFGSSIITTSSRNNEVIAGSRYELQVQSSNRVRLASNQLSTASSLLNFANNSLAGFADVSISIDDSSGTGSVRMDSNTVNGITPITKSSLAGNRYEVSFKKSKTVTLAVKNSTNVLASSFIYSNNSVTGFPDVDVNVDDEIGDITTALSGNTFNIGSSASSSSTALANRYEVSVTRGSRTKIRTTTNSPMASTEWYTYENNTVTGYPGGIFDITNGGDAGTARFEGNIFSNGGGLQFTGSPIDTIQLNFQNLFRVTHRQSSFKMQDIRKKQKYRLHSDYSKIIPILSILQQSSAILYLLMVW